MGSVFVVGQVHAVLFEYVSRKSGLLLREIGQSETAIGVAGLCALYQVIATMTSLMGAPGRWLRRRSWYFAG